MDKKIGLEHTIRNLISESLGGGVTTDKFSKTGKAFFRPVHIEPKKSGEHVNGSSSVRAARNAQLSKDSETVKEEEQLDEYAGLVTGIGKAVSKAAPYVDDAAKMLDDLLKTKPKSFDLPPAPVKPKPLKPTVQPAPAAPAPVVKPAAPPVVKPAAPPVVKPAAPPVVKPAAPPVVKPAAPPVVKPAAPAAPAAPNQSPATIKAPPVNLPGLSTPPDNKAKTDKKPGTVPAPAPGVSPSGNNNKGKEHNKNKTEEPTKRKRLRLPFPTLTIEPTPISSKKGYVPVDSYTHMAQDRRTYGESMEVDDKRENIEAVPRRNGRNRTRQAEIIRKIIEEKKNKKKIVSTVKINPELKNQEPDQN